MGPPNESSLRLFMNTAPRQAALYPWNEKGGRQVSFFPGEPMEQRNHLNERQLCDGATDGH
jgi:hypothetical protein